MYSYREFSAKIPHINHVMNVIAFFIHFTNWVLCPVSNQNYLLKLRIIFHTSAGLLGR